VFCGGQIVVDQPVGHADDGGYVLPDGASAFVGGHGCDGYKPAQLDCDAEPCTYGWHCGSGTTHPDECASAVHAVLPAGYPFQAGCVGDPQGATSAGYACAFNQQIPYLSCAGRSPGEIVDLDPLLACHTGQDGDAFCAAYLTQYVLGGGVASAKCVAACKPTDEFDGTCATTAGAGNTAAVTPVGQACGPSSDCAGLAMCVTRNGQAQCELPCTSP
jgi:hypothetical protein